MVDIPITANERKAQFTGNTGLGPFAFTFNIFTATDIAVIKNSTTLVLTSEYTVSINGDGTGSVTLTGSGNGSALNTSDVLTIIGARQLARTSDYVQGGNLFAEALNEDLDSLVIMMQQLDERVSRTLRVNAGDIGENLLMPRKNDRAEKVLSFDTEGNPTATSFSDFVTGAVLGANYVTNTALGDGSRVTFALTQSPGVKNNVQVYIDGVYQNKNSFSISGVNLTFGEAPPVNSQIEFIIGTAIGSISGDPNSITYNQGGTGAQDRTLTSRLRDTVSVKDFGAVGDGVTDDTAAFNACRAASGGRYLIPPGSYVLDLSPNVWEDIFIAPFDDTFLITDTTYNISGSFGGGFRTTSPNQTYLEWEHARTGARIARWSDGASSGDSNRFFLPFDVRRNSHFFIAAPSTNNGATDLLFRRSEANPDAFGNRFQITFQEGQTSDNYQLQYATTASGSPSFNAAYSITNGVSPSFIFPEIAVDFRQGWVARRTSGGIYQYRVVTDPTTMTLRSEDTSAVVQSDLVVYGQHTVTTLNKRQGNQSALPFTGRQANSFSQGGSLASGATLTFPIVGASNFGFGTVKVLMVGSGSGSRFYKTDFKFDGTTLTTDASTLNAGDAALAVTFSVVSSQLELSLNYTGGLGGTSRYSVDVDVLTANP